MEEQQTQICQPYQFVQNLSLIHDTESYILPPKRSAASTRFFIFSPVMPTDEKYQEELEQLIKDYIRIQNVASNFHMHP